MIKVLLAAGGLGVLAVPAIAIVAAIGVGGSALACIETSAGGILADTAPVPAEARAWVSEAKAACPDLPEAWIAAVMAQESGFRPDAHADDVNGGTWGLFQLNATVWQDAYGNPWSADLDGNGIWDVKDGNIHARVGGQYLCRRLTGVREIRAAHPEWASSQLPILDALIIAHNAGEARLREIEAKLADPDLYRFPMEADILGREYERLTAEVAELYSAWESEAASLAKAELPAGASGRAG